MKRSASIAILVVALASTPVRADEVAPEPEPVRPKRAARVLEQPPEFGTFYDNYEPTFYTGFAPRPLDPRRVHLHVGRGNQLRITIVLSDETLRDYARDLQTRGLTYRELIDGGRIRLTQNDSFAAFEADLAEIEIDELVEDEDDLSPGELRERNLELLERLNPGRVFRIEIPENALVRQWLARLAPEDANALDRDRRLHLLNALLPTRLWIAETTPAMRKELAALVKAAPAAGGPVPAEFSEQYFALLEKVSHGFYPRREGELVFDEFTAIHPIGTFNDYTDYKGRKIPLYPTPGRRALTTHQRTKTVEHIPTIAVYSYSPWIPYMHVGTTHHNSFHTLWWRMYPEQTVFLPESWLDSERAKNGGGEPFRYLWLLSRGPMSSGCTHLTTGHISELRQLMPSDTAKLYEIDTFLNRSYDYDVFDIDGDLEPEVMGVKYFVAYSLRNKKPNKLRVRNERSAYYDWLYAGELTLGENGDGVLRDVQDGRFVERTAKKGAVYDEIPLYEAEYEPERIQFYRLVDIPFAQELRRVGVRHPFEGRAPAASASGR